MKKLLLFFCLIFTTLSCTNKEKYKENASTLKTELDNANYKLAECPALLFKVYNDAKEKNGGYLDVNSKYYNKSESEAVSLIIEEIMGTVSVTKENNNKISQLLEKLENEPSEYKGIYEDCLTYYRNIKEMQDLNSGSNNDYLDYMTKIGKLSSENKELSNRIKIILQ